jgi:hypothetical protein
VDGWMCWSVDGGWWLVEIEEMVDLHLDDEDDMMRRRKGIQVKSGKGWGLNQR